MNGMPKGRGFTLGVTLGPLGWMVSLATGILLLSSGLRHELFQSTAFDLGIFDQAAYLISRGLPPISSYMGYHILGDHAAFIWYPIALLYRLYPTVYWLFLIQAIALASGAIPTFHLAVQAGLNRSLSLTMAIVYLLHPLIFNVNLFDFHPEVIAVPIFLLALWQARQGKISGFVLSLLVILSCKAVLSLTVAALGFWLLIFDRSENQDDRPATRAFYWDTNRLCGAIALTLGVAWFWISSQIVVPHFSGQQAAAVGRYSYLGDSVLEIAKNVFLQPQLVLGKVLIWENIGYLLLLFLPFFWAFSKRGIWSLVGAIPCIAVNLIADYSPQKDLVHQYSLPALPFLILMAITTLSRETGLFRTRKFVLFWTIVGFIALAKFTYFGGRYLSKLDTWPATRAAIALIPAHEGRVLTTASIAPHLSHRITIALTAAGSSPDLSQFDYILLNQRHPDWGSSPEFTAVLLTQLQQAPNTKALYQQDGVYLFGKSER